MSFRVSYKQVLDAFYQSEDVSWIELAELFSDHQSPILAKNQLADILVQLRNVQWIEKIPGLPMKWKITPAGKMKIEELLRR